MVYITVVYGGPSFEDAATGHPVRQAVFATE
jgi:hypothetical protein